MQWNPVVERCATKLMRVAFFLLLLLAAIASGGTVAAEGAVEVEVEANGDVHSRVGGEPIQPEVESRPAVQVQFSGDSGRAPDSTLERDKLSLSSVGATARASLIVLQKELEVVEKMLALQAQKMQTLERMRMALSEESESGSSLQALGFTRRQSTQTLSQSDLEVAVQRKLDLLTAHAVEAASSVQFDSYFVERAIMELPSDVVDIKIAKLKAFPGHDIIAVAHRSGTIQISLISGPDLLQLDTKLGDLAGMQLDLESDPPVLAVFSRGQYAQVCVYALHVQQNSDWPGVGAQGPRTTQFSMTATVLMTVPETESPSHTFASAIAIARSARRTVISVAQADGRLGFYSLNGSRIHDVPMGSHSVPVVTTHRHLVAFANGTSTFVFPMSRNKVPEYQHCEGSLATVTSIAFDPMYPDVVYTGTTDGEVLAFSLLANPESQVLQCKLLHRSVVRRGQPVEIAVFKGYLVAASSTLLTLFNVTRSGNDISLGRVCSRTFEAPADRITASLAVAESIYSTTVAIITSGVDTHVPSLLVLQALFPDGAVAVEDSTPWRGITTIGSVVIAVLAAQYFLRRQQPHEKTGLSETEQWRELIEKRRREGPSSEFLGKGFSSNRATPPGAPMSEYTGDPTMFGATAESFAKSKNRKMHRDFEDKVEDAELRRKIAQARRETLECTFDDDEDEDEY